MNGFRYDILYVATALISVAKLTSSVKVLALITMSNELNLRLSGPGITMSFCCL